MAKETKELFLEVLSEESSQAVSTFSGNSSSSLKKDSKLDEISQGFLSDLSRKNRGEGEDSQKPPGVIVGKVILLDDQGLPFVDFPENPDSQSIEARSTVQLNTSHYGENVVLMFENGDIRKPIIMGVLVSSQKGLSGDEYNEGSPQTPQLNVELDGEQLRFTAKKEIVLQCGKASITLTKSGKILIRGAYVSSRSSGPNLIKGGSVQLN